MGTKILWRYLLFKIVHVNTFCRSENILKSYLFMVTFHVKQTTENHVYACFANYIDWMITEFSVKYGDGRHEEVKD